MSNDVVRFDLVGDVCGPVIAPEKNGQYVAYEDYKSILLKLDTLASHVRGVILHQQIAKDEFAYDRAMEFLRKGMEGAGCAVEPK